MTLFLDIAVGQPIRVGDAIISLELKSGRRARLKIDPAPGVDVRRELASASAVPGGAAPLAA